MAPRLSMVHPTTVISSAAAEVGAARPMTGVGAAAAAAAPMAAAQPTSGASAAVPMTAAAAATTAAQPTSGAAAVVAGATEGRVSACPDMEDAGNAVCGSKASFLSAPAAPAEAVSTAAAPTTHTPNTLHPSNTGAAAVPSSHAPPALHQTNTAVPSNHAPPALRQASAGTTAAPSGRRAPVALNPAYAAACRPSPLRKAPELPQGCSHTGVRAHGVRLGC